MFCRTSERDAVVQNLKDAGCSSEFMKVWETELLEAQLRMLAGQRRRALDGVHAEQKKLDRLDYLRYQLLEQKKKT